MAIHMRASPAITQLSLACILTPPPAVRKRLFDLAKALGNLDPAAAVPPPLPGSAPDT